MDEKRLHTPRGEVCYWISRREDANAPCLVLTHGLTADHTMFEPQERFFAERCTVVSWDAPLHGGSRPYSDFSYAHAGEDLAAILDAERIPKAVFVGMSAGGYIAQAAIALRPTLAAGFVGIDTSPLGAEFYPAADLFWLRQTGWLSRLYPDRLLRRAMARSACASESAYRKMTEMLSRSTKAELCGQLESYYGAFPAWKRQTALPCPVRLVLGQHDKTGKVREYNVHWARQGDYDLTIAPNAAHFSNWDNPNAVNRAIAGLLDELEAGRKTDAEGDLA